MASAADMRSDLFTLIGEARLAGGHQERRAWPSHGKDLRQNPEQDRRWRGETKGLYWSGQARRLIPAPLRQVRELDGSRAIGRGQTRKLRVAGAPASCAPSRAVLNPTREADLLVWRGTIDANVIASGRGEGVGEDVADIGGPI